MLRSFMRQIERERKLTESFFNRLLLAINSEIGSAERRISTRLEEIDASLGLIALELARRADDAPPCDTGS